MRTSARLGLIAVVTACAFVPPACDLRAQSVRGGLTAMGLRLTREIGPVATASGSAFGIDGTVSMSRFALTVRYHEGHLSGDTPPIDQDFVEGEIMVSVEATRWAAFSVGPHVRAYVEPTGTERWVMWEAHLRLHASLLPSVGGFVEFWPVLGSSLNVADPFDSGYGIEGGIEVRLPNAPLHVRLRYRTEHANLGSGARRETLEQVALVAIVGRP